MQIDQVRYTILLEQISNEIKKSKTLYKGVYPILKGGYIFGIDLAQKLNIPIVKAVKTDILIADDLIDSGKTIEQYKSTNDIAVLIDKCGEGNKSRATYSGMKIEPKEWIKFYWEKDETIEDNITRTLQFIGEDINREGLIETPKRVAKLYQEFFNKNPEPKIAIFDAKDYDQMIIDKDIPFYSFCEHHIIPFFGTVTIGYIPDKKVIGLSKLARIVEYFAKRLNTQEYLTRNIADYIQDKLKPSGVGVIIKARHLCKEMRGVKKRGEMITSALTGTFRQHEVRSEFLRLT